MLNALVLLLASLVGVLHPGGPLEIREPEILAPERPEPIVLGGDDENSTRVHIVPTWPITFYFENRKEAVSLSMFEVSAFVAISRDALSALSHHLRCYRTDRERPLHPRLAEIVALVTEAFGRENVSVVSGYRAPPYGSPHSRHFAGRAMDFRLPNVPSKKVAAWIWKNFRNVGVGYYPKQNFVHVDVRDLDVRWIDTSLHGESAHARYFGRKPEEEPLPPGAPLLAYDEPHTPPLSAPSAVSRAKKAAAGASHLTAQMNAATSVTFVSLSTPGLPAAGIRGAD